METAEVKRVWGVDVEGEEINVFSFENADVAGGFGYRATVPGMDTGQGDPLVRLLYSENGDPLQVLAEQKPKVRDDDPLQSLL